MYDLIIRNGQICDGTGKKEYTSDIAVRNGIIEEIGDCSGEKAKIILDASGKTVTPGFIDMHSHADCSVPMYPEMENLLGQGITTCFAGHCGFSLVPVNDWWLEMDFEQAAMDKMMPDFCGGTTPDNQRCVKTETFAPVFEATYGKKLDWGDFGSYTKHLEKEGIGCNMSFQIGHSQLRQEAMGKSFNCQASEEEIKRMLELLRQAMEQGAWGLSIGLDYLPSTYADEREILPLMKMVAEYDGTVTAHVQFQSRRGEHICENHIPLDGYREFLELGKKANVHIHISHVISGYPLENGNLEKNKENTKKTIELFRKYQSEGVHVTWDVLPYSTISMFYYPQLANYMRPYVDRCGGIKNFARTLRDTNYGELIAEEIRKGRHASVSPFSRIDPVKNKNWADKITIKECSEKKWRDKNLSVIAAEEKKDTVDMLLKILETDPYTRCISKREFDRECTAVFEKEEDVTYGTDNGAINYHIVYREKEDFPYYASTPSAFCGMIRAIEDSPVKEKEKMIAALTGNAAKAAGYRNRGIIKKGYAADLLILDYENLRSNFNAIEPQTAPDGIDYVIVNGKIAVQNKVHMHIKNGEVLKWKRK